MGNAEMGEAAAAAFALEDAANQRMADELGLSYEEAEARFRRQKHAFDPTKHLRQLRGKGGSSDYLDVKWRIAWFRAENSAGKIVSELVQLDLDRGFALFRATVIDDRGAVATDYGSETIGDFGDFIEKSSCVPLRSRILSRRGLLRYDEVRVGEDVLAYDSAVDRTVWTPLLEVKVYREAEVIALTNRWGYRLECTPDHTWAVRYSGTYRGKDYHYCKMREAAQIKTSDRLVLAAPAPGGDSPITPEEAAIIGWLFTDGTIKRDKQGGASVGIITQSKPPGIALIRSLVGDFASLTVSKPYTATIAGNARPSHCLPQHSFAIPAAITRALFDKAGIQTDADLPALATRLSVEAREAMFAAMMAADGTTKGTFGKKRRPGTMEAWRVLCALRGVATGALKMREHGMPSQRARKTRHMHGSQIVREEVGLRPVWCPTTAHGTWVMEQDGTVVITGNTKAIGRALGALGYGTAGVHDLTRPGADEPTVVDAPIRRSDFGNQTPRPQPGNGERQERPSARSTSSDVASEAQHSYLNRLRLDCGLPADSEFAAWLGGEGLDGPGPGERYSKSQAGAIIDYLIQLKRANSR